MANAANYEAIKAAQDKISVAHATKDARALASAFVDLSRAAIFVDAVDEIEDHILFFAHNYKLST